MFLFCQPYLLLELPSSRLLAETSGKCPLVFSVNPVCPCVHEDEGCREQWSSLGGHVSGHQHATHHIISHQHHHHHYCKQFNHYYSIISSDAKYEVLKSQIFETILVLQAVKESSKFGIHGPPSGSSD